MQLWLVLDDQPDTHIPRPLACPHVDCGGRRPRFMQAVGKRVRGVGPRAVVAHRYACGTCGRTFRVYPAGVDGGTVGVGVKRFAVALRWLGLSFRDVSRALGILGVPLEKSQVQAVVAPRLKGLRHRSAGALLRRVVAGGGGDGVDGGGDVGGDPGGGHAATVMVLGRALPLRRAVDGKGRPALVIDGVDRECRLALARGVGAVLAGLGVRAEVVFPTARMARAERGVPAAGVGAGAVAGSGAVGKGGMVRGVRRMVVSAVGVMWRSGVCAPPDGTAEGADGGGARGQVWLAGGRRRSPWRGRVLGVVGGGGVVARGGSGWVLRVGGSDGVRGGGGATLAGMPY